jgi:transcriptional regulator with XRE-family HTH domain
MDDLRFGAAIRAARVRRGWRQVDLAVRAGISDSLVSRIERGHLDEIPLNTLRAVAAVLEIRVELLPRSRAADLDRPINAKHAALTEAMVGWLRTFPGWEIRPEYSFSIYGERGVIDLIGWHAEQRALLQSEHKTDIVDPGELFGTLDRRRRLGPAIVESLGWTPATVSTLLVIGESDTNRRRVSGLGATFAAALPDRIPAVRSYLRSPDHAIRGLMFFADRRPGQLINGFATVRRVRVASKADPAA